ncbi:hypothetical protein RD055328_13100 [Companilactobacillus sp. RD055328]|uniref:hypothetical protein n=1 Tax=Companilactobacillus sp. RD055328 TaxID=2916634 RepID=UPI001FC8DCF0|nr:hypothetical protein [Companilactobacillus sp. RD055328]GKQ43387.1 hypothetical protein RD055328_13100 [Companilactobacillus sp. RD055328]
MKKISSLQDLISTDDEEFVLTDKAVDALYDNFEVNLVIKKTNKKSGLFKQFFTGMFSSVNAEPLSSMGSISYDDSKSMLKVTGTKIKNEVNEEIFKVLSSGVLYELSDKTILFKK